MAKPNDRTNFHQQNIYMLAEYFSRRSRFTIYRSDIYLSNGWYVHDGIRAKFGLISLRLDNSLSLPYDQSRVFGMKITFPRRGRKSCLQQRYLRRRRRRDATPRDAFRNKLFRWQEPRTSVGKRARPYFPVDRLSNFDRWRAKRDTRLETLLQTQRRSPDDWFLSRGLPHVLSDSSPTISPTLIPL